MVGSGETRSSIVDHRPFSALGAGIRSGKTILQRRRSSLAKMGVTDNAHDFLVSARAGMSANEVCGP